MWMILQRQTGREEGQHVERNPSHSPDLHLISRKSLRVCLQRPLATLITHEGICLSDPIFRTILKQQGEKVTFKGLLPGAAFLSTADLQRVPRRNFPVSAWYIRCSRLQAMARLCRFGTRRVRSEWRLAEEPQLLEGKLTALLTGALRQGFSTTPTPLGSDSKELSRNSLIMRPV